MAAHNGLVWSGDGFSGERSGYTSSVEYYEHNVDISSLLKSLGRIGQVK